jgi:hypothetical protein
MRCDIEDMFGEYIDRLPVEDGKEEFVIRSGTLTAPQQSLTTNQLVIKKVFMNMEASG